MRIVEVTPRYPPQTGGVETHVARISEQLVGRGNRVTVVTADARAEGNRVERRNGVLVRRTFGFAHDGAFHLAPGVATAVRRLDADLIHAHNYHSFPLVIAGLARGGAPFVVTPHFHGASADPVRDALLRAYRPVGRWALRSADAVVAVSSWEQSRLTEAFGVDVTVIPNGVDISRFTGATPAPRPQPYLLTVGRIEKYKGVQHAIRTLTTLPEYELVVAGDGPYRDHLARLAVDCEVDDRVSFLGYVDDDRLPGLYAGADVHLSLSSFEAFGITVAESLAAGTPCVVREVGALSEWAERSDCVGTSSVAPAAIATAVEAAIGRDAPAEPIANWDDVTGRLIEVYERVI